MKLSTYTLIGFFFFLLKPLDTTAASSYQFSNGSCASFDGQKWVSLDKCPQTNYSFKHSSSSLFCQYALQPGESIESAIKKTRYYRAKNMTRVIRATSGFATANRPPNISSLLFSRRDLLSKNKSVCGAPNKNLENSAYILHIPNSLYVLKSGLSQVTQAKKVKKIATKSSVKKASPKRVLTPPAYEYKSDLASRKYSLNVQPELFYEILKGEQLSNGSTADLSSKLSTGLKIKFNINEEAKFYYGVFTDLKFHLYNEKADELLLANNSIQSLEIGLNAGYKIYSWMTLNSSISGLEDIYYERLSSIQIGFEKEIIPRAKLSADLAAFQNSRFKISIEPTVIYDLSGSDLGTGFGFEGPLKFRFTSSRQNWSFILNYRRITKDLTDLELKRNFLSASLLAGLKF